MTREYKIIDDATYVRDGDSKALVATDKKALLASRKKRQDSIKIANLETEINIVRKELSALKEEIRLLQAHVNYQR